LDKRAIISTCYGQYVCYFWILSNGTSFKEHFISDTNASRCYFLPYNFHR